MDAIERGGFAASFIAQDGIGMVAPRIAEGLNRNREIDENGKKTGPLNWEFARREGIREILSGPSAFLIPMGILSIVKKKSGTGNNVHVSHIDHLGQSFSEYAKNNTAHLNDAQQFKKGYYAQVFENALKNSTGDNLPEAELKTKAQEFSDKLIKVENLRSNKNKKEAKKLYGEIINEYMDIRKANASPTSSEVAVVLKNNEKTLNTNIRTLTQSLTDYTNDALKNTKKFLTNNTSPEVLVENINKFNKHRAGTRVLTNFGMFGAVVGFYTLIPKLYNLGLKQDPGLKGLVNETDDTKKQGKDVAFQGKGDFIAKTGETAMKNGKLGKLFKNFEFDGASMSVNAMLTLLFGFCFPPRYMNAKSDKERKEIVVRDLTSFGAILFAAKALSRGFSNMFAKISGLALNIKPENHNNNILTKFKNYFSPGHGIEVLNTEQIISKYSNIDKYKDGINGFFEFVQENGGNIKKLLGKNKDVKVETEKILKEFNNGKNLKDSSIKEIDEAFKKAKNSEALKNIYKEFASPNNKFVNMAKTYNSTFGFASTILLVPVFMMWLARYCERMTKRAIEKEQAQNIASKQPVEPPQISNLNKPTMEKFINQ